MSADATRRPDDAFPARRAAAAAGAVAALVLAVMGQGFAQQSLETREFPFDTVFLFALAGLLFLISVGRDSISMTFKPPAVAPEAKPGAEELPLPTVWLVPAPGRRRLALAGCALLAALAFLFASGGNFTLPGVLAWVGACALFLYVYWEQPPRLALAPLLKRGGPGLSPRGWLSTPRPGTPWLMLLAVILVAAFFRLYQLSDVPTEMVSDHAEKLLDVKDVLDGMHPIFFPRNTGREAIQFYLAAVATGFFGLSFMSLKVVTAGLGLLAIPFVYLLGREAYNDRVGIIAAFLTAVGFWPTVISRNGLRFPLAPLFAAATLYFLFRAMKYRHRNDYLLCGLMMGLGLHGYSVFRVVPLLVALSFALSMARAYGDSVRAAVSVAVNGLLAFVMAALVFLPLGRYMLEHPDLFWLRAITRVSSAEQQIKGNPLTIMLDNIKNSLLMFNGTGDTVWLSNIPQRPALDYITGGLFFLGVLYCLYRGAVRPLRSAWVGRGWRGEFRALYLLGSGVILLLPSTLSLAFPQENPSMVRSGSAIPIVFILAAIPLYLAGKKLMSNLVHPYGTTVAIVLVGVLLVRATVTNFHTYFGEYALSYARNSWNTSEVAKAIREYGASAGGISHAYLKSWPHWVDHRNVGINLGDILWDKRIFDVNDLAPRLGNPRPAFLVVLNPADQESLATLRQRYPEGREKVYPTRLPEKRFLLYEVPPPPGSR